MTYLIRKDNKTYKVEDFDTGEYVLSVTRLYPERNTIGHWHDNDEVYFIANGVGKIQVGLDEKIVKSGEFIHVPCKAFHRVWNTGLDDLVFVCGWIHD